MDALDVAIIRAMGIRPYERVPKPLDALRPARLARATHASVNTVKERIAAMTWAGVSPATGRSPTCATSASRPRRSTSSSPATKRRTPRSRR